MSSEFLIEWHKHVTELLGGKQVAGNIMLLKHAAPKLMLSIVYGGLYRLVNKIG